MVQTQKMADNFILTVLDIHLLDQIYYYRTQKQQAAVLTTLFSLGQMKLRISAGPGSVLKVS